ncbi:50S ribosome-binding protein YggL [Gimesia sp.]|uniref:50S ribosome-binding protein YggL n=1 Tax=Gimesia sp. TaxID=2024833 RepID=UPI003A8CCF25
MRRRLRKKKHLGEFIDWAVAVTVNLIPGADFDTFLDDWIEQAIEGNHCSFGGCSMPEQTEGIIQLGTIAKQPEKRLERITDWLKHRSDVLNFQFSPLFDAWNGPFLDSDGQENNF